MYMQVCGRVWACVAHVISLQPISHSRGRWLMPLPACLPACLRVRVRVHVHVQMDQAQIEREHAPAVATSSASMPQYVGQVLAQFMEDRPVVRGGGGGGHTCMDPTQHAQSPISCQLWQLA